MTTEERARRVANRILEELSELMIKDVSDPRLQKVNITEVKVDRELAYATIYFSVSEGHDHVDEVMTALERAKGYFRSQLASRIQLRSFPQIRFRHDPTPERVARIEDLLAEIKKEEDSEEEDNS